MNVVPDDANDRPLLALAVRLAGMAGIATMAALIKLASDRGVHLVEIIFWRQVTTIPLLLGWAMFAGGLATLGTSRPRAHFMRGFYGFVGMVFNFAGLALLPLAEATTFSFAAPIFAVMLAPLMLGEKVGVWRWSAALAGFAGIVVIAQPGGHAIDPWGAVCALSGALMVAVISMQIRDLNRTDKPFVIVFWFAALSTLCVLPALPFVMSVHGWQDYALLIGIGLSGSVGQLLITLALRFGKVSSVMVMDYSSLIWATLYGWLFFAVLPTPATWIGAPLVVVAGMVITWREARLARRNFAEQRLTAGT